MAVPNYRAGSIIEVRVGGQRWRVLVDCRDEDIKNGMPGWDGTLVGPDDKPLTPDEDPEEGFGCVWGYDAQIARVIRY